MSNQSERSEDASKTLSNDTIDDLLQKYDPNHKDEGDGAEIAKMLIKKTLAALEDFNGTNYNQLGEHFPDLLSVHHGAFGAKYRHRTDIRTTNGLKDFRAVLGVAIKEYITDPNELETSEEKLQKIFDAPCDQDTLEVTQLNMFEGRD